jgi:glycosyltransferase involved in cell wall biosynthesis
MRILVLNHNLRERGTYFRAREVALGFHRLGHDVTFVGTGHGYYRARTVERRRRWHHWESANWSLLREGGEGFSPLGMLQRLGGLRRRRWDLVYTFSHTPIDQGTARLLRRPGTFWMTDWCDLWNSRAGGMHDTRHWQKPLPDFVQGARGAIMQLSYRFEDLLESGAARDADAVSIIVSPMRVYTRKLGIPDERVLELVSGADLGHITPLDRRECRAALGLPEDRLIVGYVANATPDNRQLEEAMRRAWTAFPNLLLLSVGPRWYPPDGFLAKAVQEGRMVDYDRRPFAEIPRYLGASDFLVMPLRDLPFKPLPVAEQVRRLHGLRARHGDVRCGGHGRGDPPPRRGRGGAAGRGRGPRRGDRRAGSRCGAAKDLRRERPEGRGVGTVLGGTDGEAVRVPEGKRG